MNFVGRNRRHCVVPDTISKVRTGCCRVGNARDVNAERSGVHQRRAAAVAVVVEGGACFVSRRARSKGGRDTSSATCSQGRTRASKARQHKLPTRSRYSSWPRVGDVHQHAIRTSHSPIQTASERAVGEARAAHLRNMHTLAQPPGIAWHARQRRQIYWRARTREKNTYSRASSASLFILSLGDCIWRYNRSFAAAETGTSSVGH